MDLTERLASADRRRRNHYGKTLRLQRANRSLTKCLAKRTEALRLARYDLDRANRHRVNQAHAAANAKQYAYVQTLALRQLLADAADRLADPQFSLTVQSFLKDGV